MPIVINYKICDQAPECGGISSCPINAFFWNNKSQRPEVDNTRCSSCGICVRNCPVNAILLAQDEKEHKVLSTQIKQDPRKESDLWIEKLGCPPGKISPLAIIVTPTNFGKEVIQDKGLFALDVWQNDTVDCRFHSVSWNIVDPQNKIKLKKLDADKYPEIVAKLKITNFPTLLIFNKGKEKIRHEKYIRSKDTQKLIKQIKSFCG